MRSAELTPIRYEALSAPGHQTRQKKKRRIRHVFKSLVAFVPVIRSLILTFSAVSLRLLLTLLLLKFHIAKVHDGSDYFIAAILLVGKETEDVHGVLQRGKVDGRYLVTLWSPCSALTCSRIYLCT